MDALISSVSCSQSARWARVQASVLDRVVFCVVICYKCFLPHRTIYVDYSMFAADRAESQTKAASGSLGGRSSIQGRSASTTEAVFRAKPFVELI